MGDYRIWYVILKSCQPETFGMCGWNLRFLARAQPLTSSLSRTVYHVGSCELEAFTTLVQVTQPNIKSHIP